jgi:hypothetical protein
VSPPAQIGVSSTFKGIYVIRYLLFAGGTAVAFAIIKRTLFSPTTLWPALLLGLAAGLIAFRPQLKPLFWPRLVLSRDALYLVKRKQAVTLPWQAIRAVRAEPPRLAIELHAPMTAPGGQTVERIDLEARQLGGTAEELAKTLAPLIEGSRGQLPPDAEVRAQLQLA